MVRRIVNQIKHAPPRSCTCVLCLHRRARPSQTSSSVCMHAQQCCAAGAVLRGRPLSPHALLCVRALVCWAVGVVKCNDEAVPSVYAVRSTISVERLDTLVPEEVAKSLCIPAFKMDTEGAAAARWPAGLSMAATMKGRAPLAGWARWADGAGRAQHQPTHRHVRVAVVLLWRPAVGTGCSWCHCRSTDGLLRHVCEPWSALAACPDCGRP
jgi:hypothetical protein